MDPAITQQLHTNSTSPGDWNYISEGGATIVFSYRGPSHPVFSGTVLRLRKTSRDLERGSESRPGSAPLDGEEEEPDDPSIVFQQKVTSKLIAPAYLPRLESVRVEQKWLEALKAASEKHRPVERQFRDEMDVRRCKAVLATDLVGGEGWAVEIKVRGPDRVRSIFYLALILPIPLRSLSPCKPKPKWGFLPNLEYLSPETRVVKARRCRFCMHSQYRSEKGESASHEYCPLDLYSGNTERMVHALRRLWKDWMRSGGTINNLKLFAQGRLIDPSNSKESLQQTLLKTSAGMEDDELMEAFVNALLPILQQHPVLQRISELQRTLDPLDIEGLYSLHAAYIHARLPGGNPPTTAMGIEDLFPEPSLDDWVLFVAAYQSYTSPKEIDPALLHYYTMAYLLSATFKDCSIIFRLGRGPEISDSITVIDLDPKSMKRLKKWADLDREIAISFVDNGSKKCYDGFSE